VLCRLVVRAGVHERQDLHPAVSRLWPRDARGAPVLASCGPTVESKQPWLTRGWGWKAPFGSNMARAKDALQMPHMPTNVVPVRIPRWQARPRTAPCHSEPALGLRFTPCQVSRTGFRAARVSGERPERVHNARCRATAPHAERASRTTISGHSHGTSREHATAAAVDYCNRLREQACAAALAELSPIVQSAICPDRCSLRTCSH
jgi:hypothetical protein